MRCSAQLSREPEVLAGAEFVVADGGFAGGGGESEEDEGGEGEGQQVHVVVVGWGFWNWLL